MGAETVTPTETKCFLDLLSQAPKGPRLELGVFKGATLGLMKHDGLLYGVDSFEGMPEPTERDIIDGWNPYPKGRLAASIRPMGDAILVKGWVPEILSTLPNIQWAFVHLDMDQYDSTYSALEWLSTRMLPKGIICCDDYFPTRDRLAGGAINEYAKKRPLTGYIERKAWWIC